MINRGIEMKAIFGSSARFKIRKRGSDYLIVLDPKASRKAQVRWLAGIWKRIVRYANGAQPDEKDHANILALMHDLGWSPQVLGVERRKLQCRLIKEAHMTRPQVNEILCWIANPGENAERDRRAVKLVSEHYQSVKLELVDGRILSRSFGLENFLASISRFVCDSLRQISEDLVILPEPSPIRICETQHCLRFFVRNGKVWHCEKHRSVRVFRSTDENRRYKFIRDNLRIPVRKLEKKIMNGRIADARDGVWKLKCLTQMHIDRSKGIKKRPIFYLRAG